MNINDRLREILETLNLNKTEFAKKIGLKYTTLDSVINEKTNNKPSFDTLSAILFRFREIDPDWLIHGIGQPFRKMDNKETEEWNLQINELNEQPPQYEKGNKAESKEEKELSEKRWELAMQEIKVLQQRMEMLEKEVKKKK